VYAARGVACGTTLNPLTTKNPHSAQSSGDRDALQLCSAKIIGVSETRQIAINLKIGVQKHKTSVDDEILPALAERLGRFVSLPGSQFTM